MDTPLRRWRLSVRMSRQAVAQSCGVSVETIASYERGRRVPRARVLVCLMALSQLPAEALVYPKEYLQEHPHLLAPYAQDPPKRGRPRQDP